jgi:hypothetical protein
MQFLGITFLVAILCGHASNVVAQGLADRLAKGEVDALRTEMAHPQLLAALNVFLGRPDLNADLKGLPRSGSACSTEGTRAVSAAEWLLAKGAHSKVIMFNENHFAPQARVFVREMLPKLRNMGFTHIGFETFPPPWAGIREYSPATGYYSIEPVFAALVRDAGTHGFTVFGYEPTEMPPPGAPMEDQIALREQGEADNLRRIVREAPENARFIIYAGWSHIAEVSLPAGGDKVNRWMASRFKVDSGIDTLTVDLTTCAHDVSKGIERGGLIHVADDRTVRVDGQYAGAVDAQVDLPIPSVTRPNRAGFFRSSLGKAVAIPKRLHPDASTVLIEARRLGQLPGEIAFDRVLLGPGENLPVYLAPGSYELIAHRGDGSLVGRVRINVR